MKSPSPSDSTSTPRTTRGRHHPHAHRARRNGRRTSITVDGDFVCSRDIYQHLQEGQVVGLALVDVRAKPEGGYWALVFAPLTDGADPLPQRWSVSREGVISTDGTYAPSPALWLQRATPILGGDGAMYMRGTFTGVDPMTGASVDAIIRYDFESAEVIYDEREDPLCLFDSGGMFTGI